MPVSLARGKDFVYQQGTLWERALFGYLFEGRPPDRLYQCLRCYKNADGGFGHGLEIDIACPESNPAQLEFLLRILADFAIAPGTLLDGTASWLETLLEDDGSLINPRTLADYPIAPWWREWGGQRAPDSIVGNFMRLGMSTPKLGEATARWVESNAPPASIGTQAWLFMLYHAYDYFWHVGDVPGAEEARRFLVDKAVELAKAAPEKQWYVLFQLAPAPDRGLTWHIPIELLTRNLDYLERSQREDGGWDDEHGISRWQPYVTMLVLSVLRNFGRSVE